MSEFSDRKHEGSLFFGTKSEAPLAIPEGPKEDTFTEYEVVQRGYITDLNILNSYMRGIVDLHYLVMSGGYARVFEYMAALRGLFDYLTTITDVRSLRNRPGVYDEKISRGEELQTLGERLRGRYEWAYEMNTSLMRGEKVSVELKDLEDLRDLQCKVFFIRQNETRIGLQFRQVLTPAQIFQQRITVKSHKPSTSKGEGKFENKTQLGIASLEVKNEEEEGGNE